MENTKVKGVLGMCNLRRTKTGEKCGLQPFQGLTEQRLQACSLYFTEEGGSGLAGRGPGEAGSIWLRRREQATTKGTLEGQTQCHRLVFNKDCMLLSRDLEEGQCCLSGKAE